MLIWDSINRRQMSEDQVTARSSKLSPERPHCHWLKGVTLSVETQIEMFSIELQKNSCELNRPCTAVQLSPTHKLGAKWCCCNQSVFVVDQNTLTTLRYQDLYKKFGLSMDLNGTEATISSSTKTRSVFYCPAAPD